MTKHESLKSDLSLLFVVTVWGVNFVVIKAALGVMPPHVVNLFRFIVSALALGTLFVIRQREAGEPLLEPMRRHGWKLTGLGLLGFLCYQLFFIIGVDHTTAGNAALLMASAPLWTAVLGHLFGYDHLNRSAWLGLTATLAGAVVIVVGSSKEIDFSNATFLGNVLMLGAAFLWGAYTAFSKPVSRHVLPSGMAFYGLVVALPFLFTLGILDLDQVVWAQVDWWVWFALIFSGGLSTGLTVAIWTHAVKQVGPSQTAVYGNLVPVIALLCSVLFLGESVTAAQIAGGVLVLGGLLLMRRTRSIAVRPAKA